MKKTFRHTFFMTATTCGTLCAVSYTQKELNVNGTIVNARDSTLCSENMKLNGPKVLDSVRSGRDDSFAFSERTTDAPRFYRLRITGQITNVSIDSTETVNIKTQYPSVASQYKVTESESCSGIKELTLTQIALQQQAQDIAQNLSLNSQTINDSLQKVVKAYKGRMKMDYIYKEPMKASPYFALFQTINVGNKSLLIFNPRASAEDVKVYAVMAISWNTYYPKAERGTNLHNIAIGGMKDVRVIQNSQRKMLAASKAATSGLIDIALTDHRGMLHKLTNLKGKVVMLDFHIFASEQSTERIMALRELYNKYHDRGFGVYQMSLNPDEHFWKTKTEALSWINAHANADEQNAVLVNYSVQNIPTYFIIDKNNTLQKRDVQIKDLDAEVRSWL